MNPSEQEIVLIATNALESYLGLAAKPRGDELPSADLMAARVEIGGVWQGAVELRCERALVEQAAATLFEASPGDLDDAQARDVLSELANIIAGNLLAVLPGPSALSPPYTGDADDAASAPLHAAVTLECEGQGFEVRVSGDRS